MRNNLFDGRPANRLLFGWNEYLVDLHKHSFSQVNYFTGSDVENALTAIVSNAITETVTNNRQID